MVIKIFICFQEMHFLWTLAKCCSSCAFQTPKSQVSGCEAVLWRTHCSAFELLLTVLLLKVVDLHLALVQSYSVQWMVSAQGQCPFNSTQLRLALALHLSFSSYSYLPNTFHKSISVVHILILLGTKSLQITFPDQLCGQNASENRGGEGERQGSCLTLGLW